MRFNVMEIDCLATQIEWLAAVACAALIKLKTISIQLAN